MTIRTLVFALATALSSLSQAQPATSEASETVGKASAESRGPAEVHNGTEDVNQLTSVAISEDLEQQLERQLQRENTRQTPEEPKLVNTYYVPAPPAP